MPLQFGWRKKAERLRMTILSAGHQTAKELPDGILRMLELFRQTARTGDGSMLQREIDGLAPVPAGKAPTWEPLNVYGWQIQSTLYRAGSQLWWLVHAARQSGQSPREKEVAFLHGILGHLGADPQRDMIIGPTSSPGGEPLLMFGWWTWCNQMPLYEVQVKDRGSRASIRVVPLGAPESDGYVRIDLGEGSGSE